MAQVILMNLTAYLHQPSASVAALLRRKGIIIVFELCCTDEITFAVMLKIGPRPIPSANADTEAAANAWCE